MLLHLTTLVSADCCFSSSSPPSCPQRGLFEKSPLIIIIMWMAGGRWMDGMSARQGSSLRLQILQKSIEEAEAEWKKVGFGGPHSLYIFVRTSTCCLSSIIFCCYSSVLPWRFVRIEGECPCECSADLVTTFKNYPRPDSCSLRRLCCCSCPIVYRRKEMSP